MSGKNILIVEDDAIIAEDLIDILEGEGYTITGVAATAEKAFDLLKFRRPDIILLDITLKKNETGIDVAKVINKEYDLPFIFITSYSDQLTLDEAIATKPEGYIVKPFLAKDILPTVKLALTSFKPSGKKGMPSIEAISEALNVNLSKQEFIILEYICAGKKNPEIAASLFISINTVKTHVKRIYQKLGVDSRVKAVQLVSGVR